VELTAGSEQTLFSHRNLSLLNFLSVIGGSRYAAISEVDRRFRALIQQSRSAVL
jgi:hypothetical protein